MFSRYRRSAREGASSQSIRTALSLAFIVLLACGALRSIHAGSDLTPQRQQYADNIRQTYNYRFGKGQPFLPSIAKIEGDDFIQPGAFPTAAYCGHCHQATYHQWRQSLHANSFRTPFYLKNVDLLTHTKGVEFSRHCEGCHNPISLFTGAVTTNSRVTKRPFDEDGVTCSVCHSIARLQPTYGLGSYVMGVPAVMVDEAGKPIPGEVSYAEITSHPDRHKQAVMKDFYRSPEFCAACHKANLPDTMNNYKWLRAIGLYDEWQASSFSKRSPLPFYKRDEATCQTCHMQRDAVAEADYGAKEGKIASHRWLGGNTAVPFYYGYQEQLQKTIDYLRAQTLNVDLFAISQGGDADAPNLIAPLGSSAFTLQPGDDVQAMVVIQNKGVGHTLIPEQRDMYEAWAEFEVTDAAGKVLAHSGYLKPDRTVDDRAHSFITRLLDNDGNLLVRHEIWERRTIASDTTIRPGRSTLVRYGFHIPQDAHGPLTLTARVNYRHFNEKFLNFALGEKHDPYPIVEMASRSRTLNLGQNLPGPADPRDNPDWMRWNNYGVALFDEEQYADAVQAFGRVAKLRPGYADALTNMGIVYSRWERYSDAYQSLQQALSMSPGDPRALYYLALVQRNQGDLDSAVDNLRKVVDRFPQSPDAHRELGFSYYQQHKYEVARKEYEAVQGIDPDDLSAHYNLAILYRRLGLKDKAAEQATLFADEKDDPMANTVALQFLRKHPEISSESVPWHLHTGAGVQSAAGTP